MLLPPLKLLMVMTNFGMLGYLVVILVNHYKSNHSLTSWASM